MKMTTSPKKQPQIFSCPFCMFIYKQLEDRNEHVVNEHRDKISMRWGVDKKWVYWRPNQRI